MAQERPHKIVVVEDEPDVRQLIEKILTSAGHSVVATTDPHLARELVRREAPDLVLCDVAMPGLDGFGVLRELRADPETARYPVVFLTAHREFSDRVRAFQEGVADFIAKPFTRDTLVRKVERLLRPAQAQASAGAGPEPEHATRAEALRDPPALPSGAGSLPSFSALPEMLRSVLIADDNRAFRAFLRDVLGKHGFTVFEAGDGEQALQIALERRPWLILTDVSMPELDGFQLCKRVRAHSLISHTPFVFLSGWDDYRDRRRGLELGADEFLSKQTPVRELLIRIHLLLQRYSDSGGGAGRPAMEGSIEAVGAPGILQMWHQSRLTGVCTVRSGTSVLQARFRDGEIVGASLGGRAGADAIFEFLGWTRGHFCFVPGDVQEGAPIGESFDRLLLEGCRVLDEGRRGSEGP